jgi:hypothetical protein
LAEVEGVAAAGEVAEVHEAESIAGCWLIAIEQPDGDRTAGREQPAQLDFVVTQQAGDVELQPPGAGQITIDDKCARAIARRDRAGVLNIALNASFR